MLKLSYIAINRMVEERAAMDEKCGKLLARNGRPVLSQGRRLSDEALLAKLRDLGIDFCRNEFDEYSRHYFSAQELSLRLIETSRLPIRGTDEDWVWIAVVCLWERWFPERPSMEMIDDRMQEGYRVHEKHDAPATCRLWLDAWRAILSSMSQNGIKTLGEFDDRFEGTQSLSNWVQDLEMELANAGLKDPHFYHERIAFCETVLERSGGWGLSMSNFKRALADTYFLLGEAKGEELYRVWLAEQPQWGWGWIGWADCYWGYGPWAKDAARAEQILKRGLEVSAVEDREYLLERLHGLYEETGRTEESRAIQSQLEERNRPKVTAHVTRTDPVVQVKETVDWGEEGLPLSEFHQFAESRRRRGLQPALRSEQTGRNDPCPCGSGKKFKRCCGGR